MKTQTRKLFIPHQIRKVKLFQNKIIVMLISNNLNKCNKKKNGINDGVATWAFSTFLSALHD